MQPPLAMNQHPLLMMQGGSRMRIMQGGSRMRRPLVYLAALMLVTGGTAWATDSTVVLGNNALHLISVLTPTGPTNAMQKMSIGVGLAGQNPSGELSYLAGEFNPTSPYYQQFLDPDQYEQTFGVPPD